MSDESLEIVVYVEYGGGITLFKVRDNIATYLMEDTVPLDIGDRVRPAINGRIGVVLNNESTETTYPRVTHMEIQKQNGYKSVYNHKNIGLLRTIKSKEH